MPNFFLTGQTQFTAGGNNWTLAGAPAGSYLGGAWQWTVRQAPGVATGQESFTVGGQTAALGAPHPVAGDTQYSLPITAAQLALLQAGGNFTVAVVNSTGTEGIAAFSLSLTARTGTGHSPAGYGGAPGGDGMSGLTLNPYTLSGTAITEIATDALALQARVHRQSTQQVNVCELWYLERDTALWALSPEQPLMDAADAPRRTRTWQQPGTLELMLANPFGHLAPENLESPCNYNRSGAYDPLLDEARQILLRVGATCWGNLASGVTATLASSDGTATITGAGSTTTPGVSPHAAAVQQTLPD